MNRPVRSAAAFGAAPCHAAVPVAKACGQPNRAGPKTRRLTGNSTGRTRTSISNRCVVSRGRARDGAADECRAQGTPPTKIWRQRGQPVTTPDPVDRMEPVPGCAGSTLFEGTAPFVLQPAA